MAIKNMPEMEQPRKNASQQEIQEFCEAHKQKVIAANPEKFNADGTIRKWWQPNLSNILKRKEK